MHPLNNCAFSASTLNNLKEWFSSYVQSFNVADPSAQQVISLKEKHSLRVCREILHIAGKLDLNANHLRLAEAMALFHDIGRFEQFTRYQTFADRKSENHAELGVKILQQGGILADLEEETRTLILQAISHHNRLSIPPDASPACLFFSKLLRDADKLDIFNLFSVYYSLDHKERSTAVELDLPDTPEISEAIISNLEKGETVTMLSMQSLNDFKLLQMAWIYDVNYQPTFQTIYERDYLRIIRDALPASARIDQVYSNLQCYLKERSNNSGVEKYSQPPVSIW